MLTLSIVLGSLLVLLAAGWLFEALGEHADALRFPPLGRLVDVGAHRLHLVHKGPSGGPTVVIEQGAGEPWIFWWAIVERVAKFASVCTYDRAGIGSSDAAPSPYSPLDSARELHTLLERARIPGPYIVVAHSYGGLIARLFTRDHRRDVAGLVLVDSFEEGIHFQPDVLPMYRRFRWMLAVMTFAARFGILRLIAKVRPPGGVDPARGDPRPDRGRRPIAGFLPRDERGHEDTRPLRLESAQARRDRRSRRPAARRDYARPGVPRPHGDTREVLGRRTRAARGAVDSRRARRRAQQQSHDSAGRARHRDRRDRTSARRAARRPGEPARAAARL